MLTINDRRLRGVEAILRPRRVAVLGASAVGGKSGNFALGNLRSGSRSDDVVVVHPRADVVEGLTAVSEPPADLDVALLSLPAAAVLPILHTLQSRGCKAAMIPSAGFTETQLAELYAFAATADMVIHGPNCMGTINVTDDVALWFYEDTLVSQERGGVALVSQSGSATFLTRATEAVGFSKIVSTGNEIDLTCADYLHWLAFDDATTAVGLVLESIRDLPAFVSAARALRQAGKPLVALKVGRTALGSTAAKAHTGALAGQDAAYRALFTRLDVPLVDDYDELASALACLSTPDLPRPASRQVAVVTDSGGEAGLAADLSTRHGVTLPSFSPDVQVVLGEALPGAAINNPLDAGASPLADDDAYEVALRALGRDPEVGSVMLIMEAHQGLTKGEADYFDDVCELLRNLADEGYGKPLVAVSSSSYATHPVVRERLGSQVPLLRGIGNGFAALSALAGNSRPVPDAPSRPSYLPSAEEIAALRSRVNGPLPVDLVRALLDAYGLPVVDATIAPDADAAAQWACQRYPVVVKVASPDVAHRSDIGAVELDIRDEQSLRTSITRIENAVRQTHPDAVIDGFEIQQQVEAGVEVVVGFATDPVFGPTVLVGRGGTLVELEPDVAIGLAPLLAGEAAALLAETQLGKLLAGYRNLLPATDVQPLLDVVDRLAWLANDFAGVLAEGDLNPVIVHPGTGLPVLVDALFITCEPEESK
ncbi:acyl-CoA synthetase (NDP forming) [Actinoplanes lutulentus]|uniref:Acyl-CoA synthetase (NDP forming) n=1 Tax=Actinoplanes lutulentus TaxID=1287878 RepID=A0A327Z2D7_9ACTN|nr:acetate--CoA ligase family protein [Actinoplanes lutulentus]RAK28772.1 acyl-CoA synthetase (NDP forming) [Actinoplanes lutulentus]